MSKKEIDEKSANNIDELMHGKETSKSRAEQTLIILENALKDLIKEKKELKIKLQNKFQEIESGHEANKEWFAQEWKKATKLENKMILLWDYWQREVEILALQKKLQGQSLSLDRQEISKKLDKLIALNAGLEKGFKERNISPDLIEKLRKKIGAWEE